MGNQERTIAQKKSLVYDDGDHQNISSWKNRCKRQSQKTALLKRGERKTQIDFLPILIPLPDNTL